jgi:hypothetical protein
MLFPVRGSRERVVGAISVVGAHGEAASVKETLPITVNA